ncbi:hypothetical protein Q4E93_31140, partial [Flavitalea sp. BT771]|uniref:hypothetical protein n=1 Tax=Flavitalea sp. BT771 TaxID=3063329 RepID=UPI0026E3DCFB
PSLTASFFPSDPSFPFHRSILSSLRPFRHVPPTSNVFSTALFFPTHPFRRSDPSFPFHRPLLSFTDRFFLSLRPFLSFPPVHPFLPPTFPFRPSDPSHHRLLPHRSPPPLSFEKIAKIIE